MTHRRISPHRLTKELKASKVLLSAVVRKIRLRNRTNIRHSNALNRRPCPVSYTTEMSSANKKKTVKNRTEIKTKFRFTVIYMNMGTYNP